MAAPPLLLTGSKVKPKTALLSLLIITLLALALSSLLVPPENPQRSPVKSADQPTIDSPTSLTNRPKTKTQDPNKALAKGPELAPGADQKLRRKRAETQAGDKPGSGHKDKIKNWKKKAWAKKKRGKKAWGVKDKAAVQKWLRKYNKYVEPKTLRITGRLVDNQRFPVANARVSLRYASKDPAEAPSVTTGEDGRFTLSESLQYFEIQVDPPAGLERWRKVIPYTTEDRVDLGDITLRSTTLVQGLVEDPSGAALAGASLHLFTPAAYQKALADWNTAYHLDPGRPIVQSQSAPDGRFQINAPPGRYILVARAARFQASQGQAIDTTEMAPPALTLRLRPAHTLTVQVQDESGQALPEARVRLTQFGRVQQLHQPKQGWLGEQSTDQDGTARFPGLPEPRYQIIVELNDHAPQFRNLNLDLSKPETALNLVVQRSITALFKLSSEATGEGLEATVLLHAQAPNGQPVRNEILRKAFSSDDGRLRIENLAPGSYVLVIEDPAHLPLKHPFTLKAGNPEQALGELTLKSPQSLTLTVLDHNQQALSGLSISQVYVAYSQPLPLTLAGEAQQTNDRGEISVDNLATGPISLVIRDTKRRIIAFHSLTITKETESLEPISLPAPGSLSGTITRAEDPGARLRIVLQPTDLLLPTIETRSDAEGRYQFPILPATTYILQVDHEGTLQARANVSIASGKLTLRNLVLD